MYSIKFLFVSVFILTSLSAFSQNTDAVFMKWKLKPGQVISYRASIDEIDTANHKNLSFNGFSKSFGDDSLALHINNFYKGLNIDPQHQKFDIHLSEKRKNIIDVEMMSLKTKKRMSN